MTKELIAVVALALTLIGSVYSFGMRIGTLTERIEAQSRQLELLNSEVRAVNAGFITWTINHRDHP